MEMYVPRGISCLCGGKERNTMFTASIQTLTTMKRLNLPGNLVDCSVSGMSIHKTADCTINV